ncbi:hypothetical protein TNCT_357031 [Trichonephila clavata]|uniref:Uncharacterized protein n=1 Tax=Trichonephila clavata TaxID=2740835 RepID=A0A8X6LDX3_TRICU|nr:hypothetical protein TNCT_357031 [Trichonephila clavata]
MSPKLVNPEVRRTILDPDQNIGMRTFTRILSLSRDRESIDFFIYVLAWNCFNFERFSLEKVRIRLEGLGKAFVVQSEMMK